MHFESARICECHSRLQASPKKQRNNYSAASISDNRKFFSSKSCLPFEQLNISFNLDKVKLKVKGREFNDLFLTKCGVDANAIDRILPMRRHTFIDLGVIRGSFLIKYAFV